MKKDGDFYCILFQFSLTCQEDVKTALCAHNHVFGPSSVASKFGFGSLFKFPFFLITLPELVFMFLVGFLCSVQWEAHLALCSKLCLWGEHPVVFEVPVFLIALLVHRWGQQRQRRAFPLRARNQVLRQSTVYGPSCFCFSMFVLKICSLALCPFSEWACLQTCLLLQVHVPQLQWLREARGYLHLSSLCSPPPRLVSQTTLFQKSRSEFSFHLYHITQEKNTCFLVFESYDLKFLDEHLFQKEEKYQLICEGCIISTFTIEFLLWKLSPAHFTDGEAEARRQ